MKTLSIQNKRTRITMILAIVISLFGSIVSKAQNEAFFYAQPDPTGVIHFVWHYDNTQKTAAGFAIWMAKGVKKEFVQADFTKFADLTLNDVQSEKDVMFKYDYTFNPALQPGEYSFALQINKTDGTTITSNTFVLHIGDGFEPPKGQIVFTQAPTTIANVNVLYSCTVQAKYANDTSSTPQEINYKLVKGPNGMSIDAKTGVITWTPQQPGHVMGVISAFLVSNPKISAEIYFEIFVQKCETPITVTGTITDKNDQPLSEGYISLIPTDQNIPNEKPYPSFQSEVVNGSYTIQADAGDYYVMLYDQSGQYYIYNNVKNFKDAQTITLTCGQNLTFDWKVNLASFKYYNVSGKIVDANDNPVPHFVVNFEVVNDNNQEGRPGKMSTMAITDSLGNYSISLSDVYQYIASVNVNEHSNQRPINFGNILYYNQTFDKTQATVLNLTGDLTDVNFKLIPNPNITYFTVSGYVKDSSNNPINNAVVFFEGFSDNGEYDRYNYFDQTNTNSEGYYEIKLPDTFKYIAYTMVVGPNAMGWKKDMMPLFYNQTYNRDDATIIQKDPNSTTLSNINFTFKAPQNQFNGSISGVVINNSTNQPFVNAFVEAIKLSQNGFDKNDLFRFGYTDANGNFTINNLSDGNYILFASTQRDTTFACGYYVENDTASINFSKATQITIATGNKVTNITINLALFTPPNGGGIVKGMIYNKENYNEQNIAASAIPTAKVYLQNTQTLASFEESNADGSFALTNLTSGTYTLSIEKEGFQKYVQTITADNNSTVNLGQILLTPIGTTAVVDNSTPLNSNDVYPNPSNGLFNLTFNSTADNVTIKVYSSNGQLVKIINKPASVGENTVEVNLSDYSIGNYLITISDGTTVTNTKVVISK